MRGIDGSQRAVLALFRVVAVTLLFFACAGNGSRSLTVENAVNRCELDRFEAFSYEHITYDIHDAFVVRSFHGRISNADGSWPESTLIHVQVYSQEVSGSAAKLLQVSQDGSFVAEDLAAGMYCLKVSMAGWQTALAAVVVDPSAAPMSSVEIEMILGV